MKKIIFICAVFMSVTAFAQTTINQNLGDFTTLKVYNGIELELIKSTDQKLEITGDKSEKVKIKNVNNTLKLSLPFSLKPSNNSADGKILIKLYYNKNINIIDANEGATITSKDFNQDKVELNAQERAFINITTKTKYLTIIASSGGIIKVSGTAKNQEVDVDLYGIYHGFNLKSTGNSTVKSGTGAKAEVTAGETLNAKVSFGGTIFYKGNPEVVKDKKVIGGIIEKRN
ncbi:head GIN domain-containing protein [Polaribacter sp. PL03]|uniref:head GIN domain-containing protein n=1 Tax=Polaribacter sp. PL03 TaxID=3088353 RepID=UPI0029CD6F69|nr:head GIN domain-containing protein [Polaribacter sp. PL03]MDX6745525.1 head GIN domain-containing protein [Polaribacter sp. PL03]